ncbi:hypothetical protein ACFLZN_00305 [Nanoarchaeota archaeon]
MVDDSYHIRQDLLFNMWDTQEREAYLDAFVERALLEGKLYPAMKWLYNRSWIFDNDCAVICRNCDSPSDFRSLVREYGRYRQKPVNDIVYWVLEVIASTERDKDALEKLIYLTFSSSEAKEGVGEYVGDFGMQQAVNGDFRGAIRTAAFSYKVFPEKDNHETIVSLLVYGPNDDCFIWRSHDYGTVMDLIIPTLAMYDAASDSEFIRFAKSLYESIGVRAPYYALKRSIYRRLECLVEDEVRLSV